MKISIVTSVYNRSGSISATLNSVASQDYPDIEHVVQDGGSCDGTLEIVQAFDGDYIKLVSERDTGVYDGLNRGISKCTGDIVGLLHSDDQFAYDQLLSDVAKIFRDPSIDGLYGDLDYVSPDNPNKVIRHWVGGAFTKRSLRYGWMPPHPTVFVRRSVYDRFGAFDTRYRVSGDYDAMLRFFQNDELKFAYLPRVMVRMTAGGISNGSLLNISRKSLEDVQIARRNKVGGVLTICAKNLRKLPQLLFR